MERAKRAYISVPRDHHLNDAQQQLKHALYERLRKNGIEPQEFHVTGLPVRSPYTFAAAQEIMSRCHGALIFAFARWADPKGDPGLAMPTVWNHLEGAFAIAHHKELLVITETNVAPDGITWPGGGQFILAAPPGAGPDWFDTPYAGPQINAWIAAIKKVDDVFLAYSTKGRSTANDISKYLTSKGVAIRDWELDFAAGSMILDELIHASRNCLGAIMLLTKDDEFLGEENYAAPRDNVIFEMGMFMQAKGRERVLVVREEGAKMPADVGGGIYLSLKDRNDINPIHGKLFDFIDKRI